MVETEPAPASLDSALLGCRLLALRPLNRPPGAAALALAGIQLVSAIADNSAHAQSPPMVPLDPLVVSASRIPTSLAETTKSTTVITREQIEARQAQRTVDLLRQLPAVCTSINPAAMAV